MTVTAAASGNKAIAENAIVRSGTHSHRADAHARSPKASVAHIEIVKMAAFASPTSTIFTATAVLRPPVAVTFRHAACHHGARSEGCSKKLILRNATSASWDLLPLLRILKETHVARHSLRQRRQRHVCQLGGRRLQRRAQRRL